MAQPRKRFWKSVTLGTVGDDGQQGPLLDGRPIRLPAGGQLAVHSTALAKALVEEWQNIAEGAEFTPDDLTLTRITGSRIERVAPDMAAMRAVLKAYGVDDNLCYRSDAQDDALLERIFSWAQGKGLSPAMTTGLMPLKQPEAYIKRLEQILEGMDADILAALGVMTPILGSLLLPLALLDNVVSFDEAMSLGHADENHQMAEWGHDKELARQLEQKEQDIADALRFFCLVREG